MAKNVSLPVLLPVPQVWDFDDVDDGKTTLLSPVFDLSSYNEVLVSYWRWYTNNVGDNSGTEYWQVEVTSDGGQNWSTLENTNQSQDAWVQRNFLLANSGVQLSDQVQFRFIAEDVYNTGDSGSGGSIIEAAIDDFSLSIFDTNTSLSGDLNGDGVLNVLDVVVLVNMVLAENACPDVADMNVDGYCNVLAVVLLVNIVLG